MNIIYRTDGPATTLLNYHFVFCPRYRRKVFLIDGVATRFKDAVFQICEQYKLVVFTFECGVDYCHLALNAPASVSPANIMSVIKHGSSKVLLAEFQEFEKTQTLWTRNFLVSTAQQLSPDIIQKYVSSQKSR